MDEKLFCLFVSVTLLFLVAGLIYSLSLIRGGHKRTGYRVILASILAFMILGVLLADR